MTNKKKSSAVKKIIIVVGALFTSLFLAAICIPFFVNVDKYRPEILAKVNENINGKLELGKLDLSLWGRVHVQIDGLKLTDANAKPIVSVKDAELNLPFLSILSGRPELRLVLKEPNLEVIKFKNGKYNAMSLIKDQNSAATSAGSSNAASAAQGGKNAIAPSAGLPKMLLAARFTFLIRQAELLYFDQGSGDKHKIKNLNLTLEDVSPSGSIPFELTADLDLASQGKIKVQGPLSFKGVAKAHSSVNGFEKADLQMEVSLADAEITDPGVFTKRKGVALGAELKAVLAENSFQASELKFRIADVVVSGELSSKTAGEVTTVDMKVHSNQVSLEKLSDLSPLVKEYGLNGQFELAVKANGPSDRLNYSADLKFGKIILRHESMKQPINLEGAISVATNELKDLKLKLSAKDFDLKINGALQNFAAPKFKFNIASSKMDLDELLTASEKAAEAREKQAKATTSATASAGGPSVVADNIIDYNAMLEPLRKNPMAAAAAGTISFDLAKIKTTGVSIEALRGTFALANSAISLKDFSMGIFDGSIKGAMSINAKTAKPDTAINFVVAGLQSQKMVENKMPLARNSVKGVVSSSLNIGGLGLNTADINSNWKGSGSFEIKDAVFSTLDVGRQIKTGVIDKLPEMLKSKVNIPDSVVDRQGEYEVVSSKFVLNPGVMNITDVTGKAHPNKGLDLKGAGTVRMGSYDLDMNLDFIDTYNLFKLDATAPEPKYKHFAVAGHLTNTLFSPKFDWGKTVAKLAENAAKGKGKELLQKALGDKLGDKLPGGAGKAIDGALKGLFGR